MNVLRVFRLGVKFASWVTPHVKEWQRQRHFNRVEGQRLLSTKNWPEAEKYLRDALTEPNSTKEWVEISAQLVRALVNQRKLEDAAQAAQVAIDVAVTSDNADAQWEALDALAYVQLAQEKLPEAIQTMDRAEQQEMKRSHMNYERLALSLRRRGKLLLESGRSEEAFPALEKSLNIAELYWGKQHREVANALTEIGALQRQMGNHVEAQKYLQRALGIYRTTESHDSTQASEGLHNLAMSLEQSGDLAGAVQQYERFLAVSERQVGGDRGIIAMTQVHLAELYLCNEQSSMARELLVQAVHTLESIRGEGLPQALELMAIAEEESGRPQEATRWREKAAKLLHPAVPPKKAASF
jgi:tetratricopeptide (TPR) repeat protein